MEIWPSGIRPLLALARVEGSPYGKVYRGIQSLRSGDALTIVRWRPSLRLVW